MLKCCLTTLTASTAKLYRQRKSKESAITYPTMWPQCQIRAIKVNNKTKNRTKHENRPAVNSHKATQRINKKGKRKVQGVPQSQTAAFPRPQEEEETDKSKQAQTEQTYEKLTSLGKLGAKSFLLRKLSLPQAR